MKTQKLFALIALLFLPAFMFAEHDLNYETDAKEKIFQDDGQINAKYFKTQDGIKQQKLQNTSKNLHETTHSIYFHEKNHGETNKHKNGVHKKGHNKKHYGHTKGKGHQKHVHHKGHVHGDDGISDNDDGPKGSPDVNTPDSEIPDPKDIPESQPKGRPGAQ